MGNLNVVMINVTSRDDGLRVLDRLDTGTETGEINVEDVAMVYRTDKGKVRSSRPLTRPPSRSVGSVCSSGSLPHRWCRPWRWARALGRSWGGPGTAGSPTT